MVVYPPVTCLDDAEDTKVERDNERGREDKGRGHEEVVVGGVLAKNGACKRLGFVADATPHSNDSWKQEHKRKHPSNSYQTADEQILCE